MEKINGYEIIDHNKGFQASDMGYIASYIAVKGPVGHGFAFYISSIVPALNKNGSSNEDLIPHTLIVITDYLEREDLVDRKEYTFEYDFTAGKFIEVENTQWWNATASPNVN
jgi:hypothetical protein